MANTGRSMGLQMSFFDGDIPLKLTKPIRLIELFAGIGAQAQALKNLGVPFEYYRICEIEKSVVDSYNAVHGTFFMPTDIMKIKAEDLGVTETDKYDYILTYSFPCTDLSKVGKQQGMSKGSGTRSGLLWEVERLLKEMCELPQILLMENVPDVLSANNRKDFFSWCAFLESLGYTNRYALLNSKDFDIPQDRERCFMLSWQGDKYFYNFPQKKPKTRKLKDVLEKNVAERYYLKEETLEKLNLTKIYRTANQGIWLGNLYADARMSSEDGRRFYRQAFETIRENDCADGDTIDAFNKRVNKSGVTISFDEEKLSALKLYLEQKGQKVETELEKSLEGLYNKTVPTGVREYLSLRSAEKVPVKGKGKTQKADESSFFAIGDETPKEK